MYQVDVDDDFIIIITDTNAELEIDVIRKVGGLHYPMGTFVSTCAACRRTWYHNASRFSVVSVLDVANLALLNPAPSVRRFGVQLWV